MKFDYPVGYKALTTQGRCESTQNQARKGVTEREDMEKAFPPVLSNLNLVVVAGNGPVEKCRAQGQQAAASGIFQFRGRQVD